MGGEKLRLHRKDFWGISCLSEPKALLAIAAMSAFGNVLGLIMIPIGPQAKLDLTTLPLLVIAAIYGPIPGFIAGILGSLVTIPQFGHPFSPLLWYDFYLLLCGIVSSRLRMLFAPMVSFLILWPTLGYWMNVIFLKFPAAVWWMIFLKELPMTLVYGFVIENLLSSERVMNAFTN